MKEHWQKNENHIHFVAGHSEKETVTEKKGKSGIQKEALENELRKIIRKQIADGVIPCYAVRVYRKGEIMANLYEGYADWETRKPIDENTLFHVYSMTKPVTGVALMILVERGIVSLQDPVQRYLPAFAEYRVMKEDGSIGAPNRALTVMDLFTMRSGLTYGRNGSASSNSIGQVLAAAEKAADSDHPLSTREIADLLGHSIGRFEPGKHWKYGLSADVIGAVIEVATGRSFGEFCKTEIFDKLGMKDTFFHVPEEKRQRLAKRYCEENGVLREDTLPALGVPYTYAGAPGFESGGAGLVTTLDDYFLFAKMLLMEGAYPGGRILQKASVSYLHQDALTLPQVEEFLNEFPSHGGYHYAHLFQVLTDPGQYPGMMFSGDFGWDGWTGGQLHVCPEEDTVVVIMGQKSGSSANRLNFRVMNFLAAHLTDNASLQTDGFFLP